MRKLIDSLGYPMASELSMGLVRKKQYAISEQVCCLAMRVLRGKRFDVKLGQQRVVIRILMGMIVCHTSKRRMIWLLLTRSATSFILIGIHFFGIEFGILRAEPSANLVISIFMDKNLKKSIDEKSV